MQTRVYQAGSVVYFAGDKSDRVYILKEGRAQSIFLSEETGYEARESINVGEFFGVKSLLGDYPQEDTVQCLSDCVVIIITYEEFENLVAKNKSIIIKMLRVFSNQLRRLNKKVNKLVEKAEDEEETNQLEGLYNIGEFYFKNQKYKNALYAYKRYFQYADENSAFYHTVENKIKACKEKLNITDDSDIAPPLDIINENNSYNNDINNEDYNKALELYDNGDYINSIKLFNALLKNENETITENSIFYMGKCYYNIDKYDSASSILLSAIKKYPKSQNVKEAILFLGKACEKTGDKEKAKAYYQKAASMPPNDNVSKEAEENISKL